jgi:hypothetical protein
LVNNQQSTEESIFVSIDSLFKLFGSEVCILAQLCRGDGTNFMAEDQTAKIKLDLSTSEYEPGIYFEGGIYVFEGVCSLTTLKVNKILLPKLRQINSEEIALHQNDFGISRRNDPNDRICIFSDFMLDNDKVF